MTISAFARRQCFRFLDFVEEKIDYKLSFWRVFTSSSRLCFWEVCLKLEKAPSRRSTGWRCGARGLDVFFSLVKNYGSENDNRADSKRARIRSGICSAGFKRIKENRDAGDTDQPKQSINYFQSCPHE